MIVYRVAQGKAWTKNTHTAVSTMHAKQGGSQPIQLSQLRAAGSETAFSQSLSRDEPKACVQVSRDVYMRKDSASVEGV